MLTYPVECLIDIKATLGEGPAWENRTGQLLWVDIENHLVNRFNPATRENHSWTVEQHPSFVVPTTSEDLLVGTRHGIVRLNPQSGETTMVVDPEPEMETNRLNDGKCDPRGRLFAGSISDTRTTGDASCYRIGSDFAVEKVITGATNSNGLCWSADEKTFYYIDTPTRKIDAFDYDVETGAISRRRTVVEIPETLNLGKPDGMTIDDEGMLWTGMFRGASVCRWNPADGQMIGKIELPCPNVTSCCFGGADGKTLFITTARTAMNDDQLREFPLAGGLFAAQVGMTGAATHVFAG